MEYDFNTLCDQTLQAEYNAALECVRSAISLKDLMRAWVVVAERHTLVLRNGMDDDSDLHTSLAVTLRANHQDVLEFYIPLNQVEKLYPGTRPISDFIELSETERAALANPGSYITDGVNDSRLNEYLGFNLDQSYNSTLNTRLLSVEQGLRLGLTYALAAIGEASFSLLESELYSDYELHQTEFANVKIICASFGYSMPDQINGITPGFLESVYLIAD